MLYWLAMPLDLRIGDVLRLKKPHACAANSWVVYRVGADIGLRCQNCERMVQLPRRKIEPRIRRIARDGQQIKS